MRISYRVECSASHRVCRWAGYRMLGHGARGRYFDGSLVTAPCPRCGGRVKPLSPRVER